MTVASAAPPDDDHDHKASLIEEFRRIVTAKQGTRIGGVPVDRFSAAQVVAMHDGLSREAQELYIRQGPERMMQLATPTCTAIYGSDPGADSAGLPHDFACRIPAGRD